MHSRSVLLTKEKGQQGDRMELVSATGSAPSPRPGLPGEGLALPRVPGQLLLMQAARTPGEPGTQSPRGEAYRPPCPSPHGPVVDGTS